MTRADFAQLGLTQAIVRFPDEAPRLRKLAATDSQFHDICEEYGLARHSLAGFEARPDAAERSEIGDYLVVIAELEGEIDRLLKEDGRTG